MKKSILFTATVIAMGAMMFFASCSKTSNNSMPAISAELAKAVARYDSVEPFHCGRAMVWKDGKCGFIDGAGREVVAPKYDAISGYTRFELNLVAVTDGNHWGYLNTDGDVVIDFVYDEADNFDPSTGLAFVVKDNLFGYINTKGEVVVPIEWADIAVLMSDGYGWMYDEERRPVLINDKGERIETGTYVEVNGFCEGLAAVCDTMGRFGFIDHNGQVVIPMKYDNAGSFNSGLAPVCVDGRWGGINNKGEVVIPLEYDWIEPFSDGLAAVMRDDLYGYINTKGELVVPFKYCNAFPYHDGLMQVCQMIEADSNSDMAFDISMGFIDGKGNTIIDFLYDCDIVELSFSDGCVPVYDLETNRMGYVDMKGKVVVPFKYDGDDIMICGFSEGLAVVHLDNRYGYVDTKGHSTFDY